MTEYSTQLKDDSVKQTIIQGYYGDGKSSYELSRDLGISADDNVVEEWRVSDKYPNYEISSSGRVRNSSNNIINGHIYSKVGRILKTSVNRKGYSYIVLANPRKNLTIHRLVAEVFIPNPEGKLTVNHIDGNKENNTVGNLEWATWKENIMHAVRTGLRVAGYGEAHSQVKYSNSYIFSLLEDYYIRGEDKYSISLRTGILREALTAIFNGSTRSWVLCDFILEHPREFLIKRSSFCVKKGEPLKKRKVILRFKELGKWDDVNHTLNSIKLELGIE